MEIIDIGIIGGGAAGLIAAISAAEHGCRNVIIFESNVRCGTKILMSGGTRCNVTNENVSASDFYGGSRNIIKNVFKSFNENDTVEFLKKLGINLKKESGGKYFPEDDKAATVLNALLRRCEELNIKIRLNTKINSIIQDSEKFSVSSDKESFICKKIILTSGGKSYPSSGSDGTGYVLAQRLGHSVIEPFPALTPILLNDPGLCSLSGITLPARISLFADGKKLIQHTGSTLITHVGLSGPAVLNISREISRSGTKILLNINFIPDMDYDKFSDSLKTNKDIHPDKTVFSYVKEYLPASLCKFLFDRSMLPAELKFHSLNNNQIKELCSNIISYKLNCTGVKGFAQAEVTAGGIPLDEIRYQTMESRKAAGLYLAGEILDVDGLIGGFNFQWAWSTGYIAGKASAKAIIYE